MTATATKNASLIAISPLVVIVPFPIENENGYLFSKKKVSRNTNQASVVIVRRSNSLSKNNEANPDT